MPTPTERRALLFLATLAALGLAARAVRAHLRGAGATGVSTSAALDRQIGAVDSATAEKRARAGTGSKSRKGRAGVRGGELSARDSSSAAPRGDRRSATPTGQAPLAATRQGPLVLYERRRLEVAEKNRALQARIDADRAVPSPAAPREPVVRAPPKSAATDPPRRVDVDTADPELLASLPWVGAALAARIVSDRAIRGPFGSLAALQRVRGVGPGLAARIAPFVTFSRPDSRPPEVIRFRPVPGRPRRP